MDKRRVNHLQCTLQHSIVISYSNMILVITALLLSWLQTCHDVSWLPNLGHCRGQNVPYKNLVFGPSYCCTKLATWDVCIKPFVLKSGINLRINYDKLTNLSWSARFRNHQQYERPVFAFFVFFLTDDVGRKGAMTWTGMRPKNTPNRRCYGRTRRSQSVFLALGVLFVGCFFVDSTNIYIYIHIHGHIYILYILYNPLSETTRSSSRFPKPLRQKKQILAQRYYYTKNIALSEDIILTLKPFSEQI